MNVFPQCHIASLPSSALLQGADFFVQIFQPLITCIFDTGIGRVFYIMQKAYQFFRYFFLVLSLGIEKNFAGLIPQREILLQTALFKRVTVQSLSKGIKGTDKDYKSRLQIRKILALFQRS